MKLINPCKQQHKANIAQKISHKAMPSRMQY